MPGNGNISLDRESSGEMDLTGIRQLLGKSERENGRELNEAAAAAGGGKPISTGRRNAISHFSLSLSPWNAINIYGHGDYYDS